MKAAVLGIIQGLTEFLPISSTAHLRIMPSFFGWDDIGSAYTAVIQIGTMASIVIYFRKDISMMLKAFFLSLKKKDFSSDGVRLFFNVALGTIPILIAGYSFKSLIDNEFRSLYVMSATLIIFSFIMAFAERFSKKTREISQITLADALFIGIFQALALVPGTTRSGATITGAFFRNMNRESAARFSFLLSIPAILISGLYKLYDEWELLFRTEESLAGLMTATIVSGVVGYIAIWFLLLYLRTHSLNLFIYYRILLGVVVLVFLYFNIIHN
ncbi:MAG: undecaprenyl-diphosphatase UppP [Ignavibacteria bacterium]|nr:undecaprenyl-diphosphatase UppP [Ignavibacteria bacterium]